MAKLNKTVIAALTTIAASGCVTFATGKPLVDQGLIEVDTANPTGEGDTATYPARLTQKAIDGMPKNNQAPTPTAPAASSTFQLLTGVVLPEAKRGFGRKAGPPKYPFFDTMEVNTSVFFDNASQGGDALKKLSSTVSNANNKYREETGQFETVTRTVRGEGNKAKLDENGNKVKETKQVPVYKQLRKFTIRGVKQGTAYGAWTAPADGVIIQRTA